MLPCKNNPKQKYRYHICVCLSLQFSWSRSYSTPSFYFGFFFIVVVFVCFLLFRIFNSQMQWSGSFQLFDCQSRGQGLLRLLCLLVCDKAIKAPAAANLDLHLFLVLVSDGFSILPLDCEQKVLDFLDFPRRGDRLLVLVISPDCGLSRI